MYDHLRLCQCAAPAAGIYGVVVAVMLPGVSDRAISCGNLLC